MLLKTKPGTDNEQIAVEIYRTVPGVYPIQSASLFESSRTQLNSLLNTVVIVMALIWPLAIVLIGMIYRWPPTSAAANSGCCGRWEPRAALS